MGGGASLFRKASKLVNSMGEAIGMNGKYQPSDKSDRSTYPNPTYAHFDEALAIIQEQWFFLERKYLNVVAKAEVDKKRFAYAKIKTQFFVTEYYHVMGHLVINSHADNFEPKFHPKLLRDVIKTYRQTLHPDIWAKTGGKQNWLHSGLFTYQLALMWGDTQSLNTWHAKHVAGLKAYNLATGRNFKQTGTLMAEVGDILFTPLHVLVLLGKEDMGKKTLDALGFCRGDGDAGFNSWWPVIEKYTGSLGTFPKEAFYAMYQMFIALCDPATTNEEIAKMLPSPKELNDIQTSAWTCCALGLAGVLHLGARLYEKIGDDAKAAECATLGVHKYQRKKVLRADCHAVLARVAARAGDNAQAKEQWGHAIREAREAKTTYWEVVLATHAKDESAKSAALERLTSIKESVGVTDEKNDPDSDTPDDTDTPVTFGLSSDVASTN